MDVGFIGDHFVGSYTLPSVEDMRCHVFSRELSKNYPDGIILPVCDGAVLHEAQALVVSENMRFIHLTPATPGMNPIERIWKGIRQRCFRNEIFPTLHKMIDRL